MATFWIRAVIKIQFYFLPKNDVGIHKSRLNEKVPLSTLKLCLKI